MDLPGGYQLLEGSERKPAPRARFLSEADQEEALAVTIRLRRRYQLEEVL